MTPIADFRKLLKGVLQFPPELNGPNRKPHPLDTVIRWADADTWSRAAAAPSVPLWHAIALHLYLDPFGLDHKKLAGVAHREFGPADRTVATIFGNRLTLALQHTATGNLPAVSGPRPEDALVTLSDFAEWARVYGLALPEQFPQARGQVQQLQQQEAKPTQALHALPEPPPPTAPTPQPVEVPPVPAPAATTPGKPRRSRTPAEFIRAAELLERVLPFSNATLWRKVKDGTFPAPTKLSTKVTAWRRSEVNDWLTAQGMRKKATRARRG